MGQTLYIEYLHFSNNFLSETAITVLMDMLYYKSMQQENSLYAF